ncbi:MAG TPA: hypothetical protein VM100_02115 [Longimicrobiales bacterium]|nr:hypothetical protein [Longimicrobiales bacterium]
MTKRAALFSIFICMLLTAASYALAFLPGGAPPLASWLMAFAISGMVAAILALGAARNGRVRRGWLNIAIGLVFLILFVGFGAALTAPAVTAQSRLWLGLPRGAAIVLYIIGFLPMLILPLAYALTFDDDAVKK